MRQLQLGVLWDCCSRSRLRAAPGSRADTVASLLGNFTINQYLRLDAGERTPVERALRRRVWTVTRPARAASGGHRMAMASLRKRNATPMWGGSHRASREGLILQGRRREVPLARDPLDQQPAHRTRGLLAARRCRFRRRRCRQPPRGSKNDLEFTNQNYSGRMGWHEIVVQAGIRCSACSIPMPTAHR